MSLRIQFENSSDIGVFLRLTNKYCIMSSTSPLPVLEQELDQHIPLVRTTISNTRIVGRLCVGNKNGLLVPNTIEDSELQHIRNSLPDDVVVQRLEERLSALGNIISCNDHVALVHPNIDRETEEIIADVLGVEVFRHNVANNFLVGTYCVFNNLGCLCHPSTTVEEQDELSNLLQVPLVCGTVNRGSDLIGSGLVVNDWVAFAGWDTTASEISVIEKIFQVKGMAKDIETQLRPSILEEL